MEGFWKLLPAMCRLLINDDEESGEQMHERPFADACPGIPSLGSSGRVNGTQHCLARSYLSVSST